MTEPIDPNDGWPPPAPYGYQPPPPYPGAPYPGAPYPGAPYPGAPYPAVALPPAPPPARRRLPLLLGLLVAVLAAAGVLVFVAVHGSDSGSGPGSGPAQLSLPDSFDGYTRLAGQQGEQFEASMRSFAGGMAGAAGALDRATIRGYTHELGETPALMVFVFPTPELPSSAPAASGQLGSSMRAIVGRSMHDYPPGPHGGELLCGVFRVGAMSEPMCVWSDPDVTGVMVSIESITPVRLSELELDLRARVH